MKIFRVTILFIILFGISTESVADIFDASTQSTNIIAAVQLQTEDAGISNDIDMREMSI